MISYEALLISLIPPLCWGIMWVLITKATRKLDALRVQFLFQLAGIPMLFIAIPFIKIPTNDLNLSLIVLLGIFETFVLTAYFQAVKIGKLAIVGSIIEGYILITLILSALFLRESIYLTKLLSVVGILTGVLLLSVKLHSIKTRGVALYKGVDLAILATIGTGIFIFFVGISSRTNGWFLTALGIRVVMSLTIAVIFFLKKITFNKIFSVIPWRLMIPAVALDVVGFSVFNIALSRYDVSYVVIISAISPVITVLLAAYVFKERLRVYQIIGLVLVVIGVVVLNLR